MKKLLAYLLSLMMIVSLVSVPVSAEAAEGVFGPTEELTFDLAEAATKTPETEYVEEEYLFSSHVK